MLDKLRATGKATWRIPNVQPGQSILSVPLPDIGPWRVQVASPDDDAGPEWAGLVLSASLGNVTKTYRTAFVYETGNGAQLEIYADRIRLTLFELGNNFVTPMMDVSITRISTPTDRLAFNLVSCADEIAATANILTLGQADWYAEISRYTLEIKLELQPPVAAAAIPTVGLWAQYRQGGGVMVPAAPMQARQSRQLATLVGNPLQVVSTPWIPIRGELYGYAGYSVANIAAETWLVTVSERFLAR